MRRTAGLDQVSDRECLRSLLAKQAVPFCLLFFFAWIVFHQAADLDIPSIFHAVRAIAPVQWAVAILATCISFWAVARMERLVQRILGTGVGDHMAQLSGATAIATAQITGFGLLVATLARWRLLPNISLWQAAQITGAVSIAFMLVLGTLAAGMVLVVQPEIPMAVPFAGVGLCLIAATVGLSLWKPRRLMLLKLPSLRAQATLLALALLDTGAAALALYVLIPEAALPPPALFYTIFLLALGAGLLGATPGGVGPFEMMFLMFLPTLPEAPMLAAIMGFRLVYFAVPAILAAGVLIVGPNRLLTRPDPAMPQLRPATTLPDRPVATGALCFNAPWGEAGLMRQGEFDLLLDAQDQPTALVAATGQSLIMLSDPLSRQHCTRAALDTLTQAADRLALTPCLYKCSARTATIARDSGWQVLRIAEEARISTADYDTGRPAHRQLRRQIRKAEKSGVHVENADARPPLQQMHRVARDWAGHRGGARGFSMGQFHAQYISAQRTYLALHDAELVAFLTLHESCNARSLDLMCHTAAAPPGTMHMLVDHAIRSAANDGCASLSLAAVPCLSDTLSLPAMLKKRVDAATGSAGLIRFKSAFDPAWHPLYLAAPSTAGMALAGIDLIDRITRPRVEFKPNS